MDPRIKDLSEEDLKKLYAGTLHLGPDPFGLVMETRRLISGSHIIGKSGKDRCHCKDMTPASRQRLTYIENVYAAEVRTGLQTPILDNCQPMSYSPESGINHSYDAWLLAHGYQKTKSKVTDD